MGRVGNQTGIMWPRLKKEKEMTTKNETRMEMVEAVWEKDSKYIEAKFSNEEIFLFDMGTFSQKKEYVLILKDGESYQVQTKEGRKNIYYVSVKNKKDLPKKEYIVAFRKTASIEEKIEFLVKLESRGNELSGNRGEDIYLVMAYDDDLKWVESIPNILGVMENKKIELIEPVRKSNWNK